MLNDNVITFVDDVQDAKIISICKEELEKSSGELRNAFLQGFYSFLRYRNYEKDRIYKILKQAGAYEEELDLTYRTEYIKLLRDVFPETFDVLRELTSYKEIEFENIQLQILSDLQGWFYDNDKIYYVFADGNRITEIKSTILKEYLRLKYNVELDSDFRRIIDSEARTKGEITKIEKHRVGITELSDNKIVLNLGQRVFIYDNVLDEFYEVKKSMYEKHYLERGEPIKVDVPLLEELMRLPLGEFIKNLRERFMSFWNFIQQWNFESKEASLLYTAFLVVLPSHTLWTWRPFVHVIGSPGAGKTLLFSFTLYNLYTNLILRADNVTPYALPQELQYSGKIPAFDNFDIQNHKHAEMFNTLEASSRNGAVILRGTTGQEARKMYLKHLPVFNSTSILGMNDATDQRTVRFRLISKPNDVINELSTRQYIELATYFIVANLRLYTLMNEIIKSETITERVKENIQYPYALLKFLDISKSIDEFSNIFTREIISIPEDLLLTILYSNVTREGRVLGIDSLILDVFQSTVLDAEEEFKLEVLETAGIYINKQRQLIGLNHTRVVRELLKGTKFSNISLSDFNEYLKRLGAEPSVRFTIGSNKQYRATAISYDVVKKLLLPDS